MAFHMLMPAHCLPKVPTLTHGPYPQHNTKTVLMRTHSSNPPRIIIPFGCSSSQP
jgi:hypothetical protein